ncbi:DUF4956 domain-containing protein [Neorhodopirellula lusitana]|uniref:DUF4956 domain-containing protein n=1 Tax=Neorhodopirellula lusitana TaxID=445327 RepID=UPI00384F96CD
MPEWLQDVSTTQVNPELWVLVTRLVLAWLAGCAVAWLAHCKKPVGTPDTLTLTLVLMSILIAMATQIIGENIARAFSLVGALSIVRFRTVVPTTQDVAFVLAAVVVGMAVGAGQYWVAVFGILVVALAIQVNQPKSDPTKSVGGKSSSSKTRGWRLTLVVGLSAIDGWEDEIARYASDYQLTSAETTRRGAAMELVYRMVPNADADAVELIAALNAVPTVESVAAKQD